MHRVVLPKPTVNGRTRSTHLRSLGVALACAVLAGCPSSRANVDPEIEFTTIPAADNGGPDKTAPVAGRVKGARADQRVVLYAKSGTTWWVQPFRSRPFTAIERDSTWKTTI